MRTDPVSAILALWKNASGTELSNYQHFVGKRCERPSTLPEEMRAFADGLATSRGAWKSRFSRIVLMIEALRRARHAKDA